MKKNTGSRAFATLIIFSFVLMGALSTTPPAHAATSADIARVATDNLGEGYCGTNSYGGKGFADSCQGMQWCAEFALWVWRVLGFNTTGLNAGAVSFVNYANTFGTHDTTPQVGDAVVYGLDKAADWAEHVGIVTEVRNDGTIAVVNGNFGHSPTTSTVKMSYGTGKIGAYIYGQQISAFVRPVGIGASATPTTHAPTPQNCPPGYVCVYPSTNFNVTPALMYYKYGTTEFPQERGNKVVFNNQTGGATAQVFTGATGTGTARTINPGTWETLNFVPLHSIKLAAAGPTTTPATAPKNCPAGYVCVYSGTKPTTAPQERYYSYGTRSLTGLVGNKLIYNHQSGAATARVFTGAHGTGTPTTVAAGRWVVLNFTQLKSLILSTPTKTPAATVPGPPPSNCPAGNVCIYPSQDFKAMPALRYASFGTFNFTNMAGLKVVYNHQARADARLYTGRNGTGRATYVAPGSWTTVDFTPLFSIRLSNP